ACVSSSSSTPPPPPISPLFPYTTLFRSHGRVPARGRRAGSRSLRRRSASRARRTARLRFRPRRSRGAARLRSLRAAVAAGTGGRSEEHTSELQSLTNLVCRLLLEKKKNE